MSKLDAQSKVWDEALEIVISRLPPGLYGDWSALGTPSILNSSHLIPSGATLAQSRLPAYATPSTWAALAEFATARPVKPATRAPLITRAPKRRGNRR